MDLLEQLAQMVGDNDSEVDDDDDDDDEYAHDDENSPRKAIQIRNNHHHHQPMTVHEIDAYQADYQHIQEYLAVLPTVVAPACTTTTTDPPMGTPTLVVNDTSRVGTATIELAGHIQHHMVDERTMVILSSSSSKILKEGTRLVLRRTDCPTPVTTTTSGGGIQPTNTDRCDPPIPQQHDSLEKQEDTNTNTDDDDDIIIPLGMILEIFGPVGQPLYSVRLPLLPTTPVVDHHHVKNTRSVEAHQTDTNDTTTSNANNNNSIETVVDHVENAGSVEGNHETTNDTTTSTNISTEIDAMKSSSSTVPPVESVDKETDRPPTLEDPWGHNGEYTRMIRAFPKLPVYYWDDPTSTNVLDTAAVMRHSGRGCDASNLFDEEIMEVQDYSDDEQERAAKAGKNKKKQHNSTSNSSDGIPPNHPHPHHQNREQQQQQQRSSYQRHSGSKSHHRTTFPSSHRLTPQFSATVPWSSGDHHHHHQQQQQHHHMMHPPPTLSGFHPNMPASAVHVGAPYDTSTTNFYATPNPPGLPQHPSHFQQQQQQQAMYMPHPQFQQPWYYYNGAYQSVPPQPPPPPPPPPSRSAQHPPPPPSTGGIADTVYYDFS